MGKLKSDNCFYGILILYTINQVFSESQCIYIEAFNVVLKLMRYAVLGMLVLFIIWRNKSVKRNKLFSLLLLLGIVLINLVAVDGGLSFIPVILIIFASCGYSVEKGLVLSIKTLIVSHIIVILLVKIGLITDTVDFRYIGSYAGSFFSGAYYRHNMGFLVHNQIPLTFFIVYMMFISYRKENIKWYENLVAMSLNFFFFSLFGSRIVFILTALACVGYYVIRFYSETHNRYRKKPFLFLVYPVCCAISFLAVILYDGNSTLSLKLDLFFNNRLRLAHEAIEYFGIGIIGAGKYAGSYQSTALLDNTVDNGYVSLFLQNGIIVGIIIVGLWTYLTYMSEKKNNTYLTFALVFLALENIVNSHLGSYKLLPYFCLFINNEDIFWYGKSTYEHTKKKITKKIRLVVLR